VKLQTNDTSGAQQTPTAVTPAVGPLARAEGILVGVLLLAMVAIPAGETIGRRFLGHGFLGSGILVQNLTLWVGFLGALLATGADRHLALSTAEVIPPGWRRRAAGLLSRMVSTAVCALLAYGSYKLVQADHSSDRTLPFGIPIWWSELIMPVASALMAVGFAWRAGQRPYPWIDRAAALAAAAIAFALGALAPSPWVVNGLLILLVAGFLVGTPVFTVMAGVAMALFWRDGTPIAAIPTATFGLVTSATLPAVPLLTVAGYVLAEGGAARRLVRAYKGLFGWLPGGIAVMAAFVCAIFTTFTGASGVTILALGGLVLPTLLQEGYPEGFSLGLVTAAGSLGLLFPPSLPVILYGVVAQVPIDHLYIGGLVPGLLMVLLVAGYGVAVGLRAKVPRQAFDPGEAARALWDAKWDLGLPVLVIVAIGSGYATVVEGSAIGVAYALFVEIVIFRELGPRELPKVLAHAATLIGAVIILLGVALGLTNWLVDAEVPTRLVEWMTTHVKSPALFLLTLNVALLVLGSVLEIYSAIIVLAPLVAPLGAAYGIEPIHLGVVFLANLELGFLFPPMGLNLFLAASRFEKPLPYLYRRALPFLVIMSVGVLLITYLPAITTGVVHALKGTAAP
jgi:tripartite ATP-independent transporter DctM subunit